MVKLSSLFAMSNLTVNYFKICFYSFVFVFKLLTVKSPTSVNVIIEKALNQSLSKNRGLILKCLTVEIPGLVHGQVYRNFLKTRTMRFP